MRPFLSRLFVTIVLLAVCNATAQVARPSDVFTQQGAGAVARSFVDRLREVGGMSIRDFGARCNGTADDTAAINKAYAAASLLKRPMIVPDKCVARFTSQLVWDKSVDVIGQNSEFSILKKDGDFLGIVITDAGQQSRYQDFTLDGVNDPSTTSGGIKVVAGAHASVQRLMVINQGGHGIEVDDLGSGSTVAAEFKNIWTVNNGGDGVRLTEAYFTLWMNLDSRGNGGYGLRCGALCHYNRGVHLALQLNVAGGAYLDNGAQQNYFELYGESNTGPDIELAATSLRNFIVSTHADGVSDLRDEGNDNIVLDFGVYPMLSVETLGRMPRHTNVAGRDVLVLGGRAGDGAEGFRGGDVLIFGGDPNGDTLAHGSRVQLRGGAGINAGIVGPVQLQVTDGGGVIVGGAVSSFPVNTSVALELKDTNKAFRLAPMTNAQEAALTEAEGMLIYNGETGKFRGRAASGWVDLH